MQPSTFDSLGTHPALAPALAQRGYETPTLVQEAVLEAPDQDLLVSSQTGSGKTVAFGLVIARTVLGSNNRFAGGHTAPRALVIAPTRELAAQVQRELAWLFANTGARIASFTGGTDIKNDFRVLKRGVDILVGTPGRLIDLVERKSLALGSLEAVVLDEADEMLDMGFREDLEKLLAAAPTDRRTLLFSATIPAEIRKLAERYQKKAHRIDPGHGAKTPHQDIEHVAHLCANGEILSALGNVLRMASGPNQRALVFCRTRENVATIHERLVSRGISAAAISGDRAQSDRDRALDALRSGRVSALVATNVAARGLDVPDVGLVVHVDLPDNTEALTHRSGRTGRAGRKGVSLFLVEMRARRKAEQLFRNANLRLRFTAAPTKSDIAAKDRDHLRREIRHALATPIREETAALAAEMLEDSDPKTVVATLLERELSARPSGENLTPISLVAEGKPERKSGRGDHGGRGGKMMLFEVNVGKKDRAEAKWLLPMICRRGGITSSEVGAIRIVFNRTFFEVAEAAATKFASRAGARDPKAPHIRIVPSSDSEIPSTKPKHVHPKRRHQS